MTLDYDDLDRAMQAHSLLRQHRLKVTFFPNRQPSAEFSIAAPPKVFHRIIINGADAAEANDLLRKAGLGPPL